MNPDDTGSTRALPCACLIPRGGTIVREAARDADDLRRIRTELELLRRIRRRAASWQSRGGARGARAEPLGRFSPEERGDLQRILRDAMHPLVDDMADQIDRACGDTRKELMMSVINEEAENIVQDAVDAGVLGDMTGCDGAPTKDMISGAGPVPMPDPGTSDSAGRPVGLADGIESEPDPAALPGGVSDALADVEAELAKTLHADDDTAASLVAEALAEAEEPEGPDADTVLGGVIETDAANTGDAVQESDETGQAEPLGLDAQDEDAPDPEATVCGPSSSEITEYLTGEPDGSPASDSAEEPGVPDPRADSASDELVDPAKSDAGTFDELYTPERASRAVAEIEQGISELAGLLGTQLSAQWRLAQDAYERANAARLEAEAACRQAQHMLAETARAREEARIARDEADVARREAKLIREDALRAKERAEASAAAAELAAEQAQRDAEAARGTS